VSKKKGQQLPQSEAGASRVELIKITPMQHQQNWPRFSPGLTCFFSVFVEDVWGNEGAKGVLCLATDAVAGATSTGPHHYHH